MKYKPQNGENIVKKDLFKITTEGILLKNINFTGTEGNIEIWANLSTENADLTEFDNRSQIVKNIVSIARKNEIKGINVYAYDIDQNLERFIIELSPKLRELGIKTNIIVNKNFNEENKKIYEDIIDYIITD